MKFLVLALCVCAASAASFSAYRPYNNPIVPVVTAPVVAAQAVANVVVPVAKTAWEAGKDAGAAVLRQDSEVTATGYQYSYETQNGIAAQATGDLKSVDGVNVLASQGSWKYYSPDGTPVELTYTADENGYHPQGKDLPVAPAVPEYIIRALEYIAAHPSAENVRKN